ncbi:MAG TPA: phytanoyl-CoA dioxygenase family protein [Methylomirabilota bacterium]|nr:phytanoyl-CoA dioxygenase family protein [Methylomirabilota bacterium]
MILIDLEGKVARDGFAVVDRFAPPEMVNLLLSDLEHELGGKRAGTRQPHQRVAAIKSYLASDAVQRTLQRLLPKGFPVRSILFDKTAASNWFVPWHQDLSICVKDQREADGFSAWSMKEGTRHVQPLTNVLENLLTIRLHLDDCFAENGPLRVIPGSHRSGKLSADAISSWQKTGEAVTCTAPKGGAVIMKPLLLHSSLPAKNPTHRRVLHMEFASEPLPQPLEWIF